MRWDLGLSKLFVWHTYGTKKVIYTRTTFLIFVVLSCISLISIMMGWLKPNPIMLIGDIIVIGAFLWEQTMKRFKS
ncbi:Uncharacterised protein [Salmonella enterica subsp. enterica]|uniref:Uncharacterized protein n=1 Tax=Salmonella enterica I TaxID=59201 RepID=A0A379W5Q5_SALET|nr:Uncharacterised protein [Salmonella enterica subsp. enterica]